MNKYRERVLNKGKETGARIVLPEIGDKRVQEAITELTTLGFKVVHIADFQDNTDILQEKFSLLQDLVVSQLIRFNNFVSNRVNIIIFLYLFIQNLFER